MATTVYARTNNGAFKPMDAAPDGHGQYFMREVHPERKTNIARVVGELTFKGKTFPIGEYT